MIRKLTILVLITAATSACTSITFDNSGTAEGHQLKGKWHHQMALSLVEVSDPVDPESQCGDNTWNAVETQKSFVNGLVDNVLSAATGVGPLIWTAKTVNVTCAKESSAE